MRRMIAILIISSFMLILSGCGAYKDADNEDIFVFSKEEQLYLSVNKKIFSRFDQAGRSIESSWVFPKNAYRFPKKVRVPLATESGLLTKATETIALSDKYEMLAKYNGSVYCDIDYLPGIDSSKEIDCIIISDTDNLKLNSPKNIVIREQSLLAEYKNLLHRAWNADYSECLKYKNIHEEERLIGIQYKGIAATLIYGYFGKTAINTISLCCFDNDPYDLMYPVSKSVEDLLE